MSDDLIRRSDAIGACAYETIECYEARKAIRALPSADRPQGEWVHNPKIGWGETWVCSICGEKTTSSVMGYPRYNYCPMCGSRMKGADDEQMD